MAAVKKKLTQQKFDEDSKTGYLTQDLEKYFACFNIDAKKLEELFESEVKKWDANLRKTEKAIGKMTEKLAVLLSQ